MVDGQVMSLRFWARSPTKSAMGAIYERAGEPYDKALSRRLILTPEWKAYAFNVVSSAFGPGGAQVNFPLGAGKGQVEIADVHLINYGVNPKTLPKEDARDYFGGLTRDQSWRTAANDPH